MAPSFTLKGLSPSRPSPLAVPPAYQASPLSSPGRSPTNLAAPDYFVGQRPVPVKYTSKDDAFKVVKQLEEVLAAWNEYRLTLAAGAKAGKKLAGALRDLTGCIDKSEVPAQTIKPSAATIEATSDVLGKLSKKIDQAYDQANTDASKYFNLLAKESRSHDAYLGAVSKKHDKAEKAYKKASKQLGETSTAHAGLNALKSSLAEDIVKANADQANLLGTKQATLLLRMASSIGLMGNGILLYHSDGLRKTGAYYADAEYFRALADLQWQCALPSRLDTEQSDKQRDQLRLIKTRVALGEADIVGEQVWSSIASESFAAPTQDTYPQPGFVVHTSPSSGDSKILPVSQPPQLRDTRTMSSTSMSHASEHSAGHSLERSASSSGGLSTMSSVRMPVTRRAEDKRTSPDERTQKADPPLPKVVSPQKAVEVPMSPPTLRSLPSQPAGARPLYGRVVSHQPPPSRNQPVELPKAAHRRSVSQIAAEMENRSMTQRQSAFDAHQTHERFVAGCTLCNMEYEQMMKARQDRGSRRVTMPPAYPRADAQDEREGGGDQHREPQPGPEAPWLKEQRRASYHPLLDRPLLAPTPRKATGTSPDFALAEASF